MESVSGVERIPLLRETERELEAAAAAGEAYDSIVDGDRAVEDDDEESAWLGKYIQANQQLHWSKRPSPMMIGIVIFVFTLASSCGDGAKEVITFKLACNYLSRLNNYNYCDANETQVLISNYKLVKMILGCIVMMFSTARIGYLSDRYGRSKFIGLNALSILLCKTLEYLIIIKFSYLKFGLMVFANLIPALTGGLVTLSFLTICYINDIVEPNERIHWLGIISAFMFAGGSLGPLIGNFLQSVGEKLNKPLDYLSPSLVTISKSEVFPLKFELLALLPLTIFLVFFMPESRSERSRRKSIELSREQAEQINLRVGRESPIKMILGSVNILQPLKELIPTREDGPASIKYIAATAILLFIDCVLVGMLTARAEVMMIYGILKFNWGEKDVGNVIALEYSTNAIVLIFLSPIITRVILQKYCKYKTVSNYFDMIDFSMLSISLVAETIFNFSFAVARNSNSALADLAIFSSFGSLLAPALTTTVIKFYHPSKIGEILGILGFLKNIATLLMSYLVIASYQFFVKLNKPGLLFISLSIVTAFSFLSVVLIKALLGVNSRTQPQISRRSSSNFASTTA